MDTAPDVGAEPTFSDDRCRQLIASARACRVAFVVDDLPHLVVLNHLLDGTDVLVRTSADTRLAGLTTRGRAVPVALEVDSLSSASRSGWSVLATGPLVRDNRELSRLPQPWRQGPLDVVLRLTPQRLTGVQVQADLG